MKRLLLILALLSASCSAQMLQGIVGSAPASAVTTTITCAAASGHSTAPSVNLTIASGNLVTFHLVTFGSAATLSSPQTSAGDAIAIPVGYPITINDNFWQGTKLATANAVSVSGTLSASSFWEIVGCVHTGTTALDVADTTGASSPGDGTWSTAAFTTTVTDTITAFVYNRTNATALTCGAGYTLSAHNEDATNGQAAALCSKRSVASGSQTITGTGPAVVLEAVGLGVKP